MRAATICVTAIVLVLSSSSVGAQDGKGIDDARLALGVALGAWLEPFDNHPENGLLTDVSILLLPHRRLALEVEAATSFAGWSGGVAALIRSRTSRMVWYGGIGPLISLVPSQEKADPNCTGTCEWNSWTRRATTLMYQGKVGFEIPVARRLAAYTNVQFNVTGTDYGNMWIVSGARWMLF